MTRFYFRREPQPLGAEPPAFTAPAGWSVMYGPAEITPSNQFNDEHALGTLERCPTLRALAVADPNDAEAFFPLVGSFFIKLLSDDQSQLQDVLIDSSGSIYNFSTCGGMGTAVQPGNPPRETTWEPLPASASLWPALLLAAGGLYLLSRRGRRRRNRRHRRRS